MQIFVASGNPDILINVREEKFNKNKDFRSGVLRKMTPSSPSMEEFALDI